ncbi:putative glycosyltransferase [Corchorus olitorius]|uniref:Glycosyltransferase n=1 Tax=Corchorus olitorius TaxID=93759 RepID=A0A1R3HNQ8_9ROSI|nr:putative glycosyltransferase [Corchorus olitorius]
MGIFLIADETRVRRRLRVENPKTSQISCNRTYRRYDLCTINGPTVLDPVTSTFFTMDPTNKVQVEKIKPYPRKYENYIMAQIKEISITSGPSSPTCKIKHDVPALVFSAGGYAGNFFHAFNEGFIALFITVNSIFPDQDFIMVASEAYHWWITTLGLITHGFMTIDQTLIPNSKTFLHFRDLLDKAFGSRNPISHPSEGSKSQLLRPRLVLLSRGKGVGRTIINLEEVIQAKVGVHASGSNWG